MQQATCEHARASCTTATRRPSLSACRWLLAVLTTLAPFHVWASTVGSSVAIVLEGEQIYSPALVGAGVEHDLGDGSGKWLDVDPVNSTITLTSGFNTAWSVPQFDAVFSGGVLSEITGITRTGGTAANVASYSAAASGKTVTFTVPTSEQDNGTIVFTYTSTSLDSDPPTVTSATSSTSNGTYKVGSPISIQVIFSEPVIVVGGPPQLTLETGSTDRTINYSGGSSSNILTFTYTVQAGDISADLDYTAINALSLNGATIGDAAGNAAVLTLPSPGTANSLGNNKALVIDGVIPTVMSVNSSTANGSYKTGDVISIQVNFSEALTVTGTPQLTLETGTTNRTINYVSGSGTSTHTYTYTIQAGDISGDLDYVATTSLALNGGTIRDAAGNDATLTLATPGAINSLGANKALVIDGVTPSVSSTVPAGSPVATDTSVDFTVTFSESVSNISTDDFALGITGTANGTIVSVSASSGTSVDVTVSGITGNGTLKLNLNASTDIADAAGNAGPAAYTSGTTHTVAIPTAPGAPTIGTATAGDGQVAVTFTAPGSNGGSAITTYTATAQPGGAFGTCAGPAACTATVTGLTNGTSYTFTVTATNAIGTSTGSGPSNSATPKGNQTLTFPNPGAQTFGTSPDLSTTASATSNLAVSFTSSTTGVCTVTSGGVLTFVTAGSCTIDAEQAGNGTWNAATTVTQTFTVNAIVPGKPNIGTATAGDTRASVTFTAPASTGGAPIIASGYTVTANPGGATGTGSSSPVIVTGLTNGVSYTFTVTATNSAGEGDASDASNSVTPAAPQTITFANPGTQNFGTTPTLTATSSAGGGYSVSFSSSTTGVCTISASGALTFVAVGSCTINANQVGDSSYLAASQMSQTFTVAAVTPGAPTAAVAAAGDTQASVAFVAPVFTGGVAITGYTVTTNPADVAPVSGASSPIVVTGLTNGQPYTFTVTADNSTGTGLTSGASNSVTPAATQIITFAQPGSQNFGTTPTFSATADSGLTPTFTSSTTGVCTITSLGVVTFVTAGSCTINADQPGNGSYLPAVQVSRSFVVNAVLPRAPTIGTATVTGAGQVAVPFTAPASNGGAAITGYTVTSSPDGITGTGAASPVTVTGLTPGTSYTFTVTATNSVGTGSPSLTSNTLTPAPALVAGAVNATVAYGSSGTIDLVITGTPSSVAMVGAPSHGTVSVSGTTISYTPHAGYAGTDSFTYTASDAYTTTPAATVSITVAAPNVVFDTASVAAATAGADYLQAIAASGGAAPYAYVANGTLPAGVTLSSAGQLQGTPTQTGSFAFDVTLTDSSTGTGPFTATRSYTLQVDVPALSAGAVNAVLAYNAPSTQVALAITGTPSSVAVVSAPQHGTVSVSGTTISYTPNPGYAGSDSFTYTASDAYTTTPAATVSIAMEAPNVTLGPASLSPATASNAYQQVLQANGGAAPYRYAVSGTLPPGLSLSANGELRGTPTVAGSFAFEVTVTDSSSGAGPFSATQRYTLQVEAPALQLDDNLPPGSGAQDYRQPLTASGGTAPYRFQLTAGALPPGLVLSESGQIGGTPAAAGSYAFTVQVTDANGFTGTQTYRFVVDASAQQIAAFVATPVQPVFTQGGTFTLSASGGGSGNPVLFASLSPATCSVQGTVVTMVAAGTCVLSAEQAGNAMYQPAAQATLEVAIGIGQPELSWVGTLSKLYGEAAFELPDPTSSSPGSFVFTSSNPAVATVSGRTVTVVGEGSATLVAQQAATANFAAASATVELVVNARPNPTQEAAISSAVQAQADVSVRFAQAQSSNIRDRLRTVRHGTNVTNFNFALAYAGGQGVPGLTLPVGRAAEAAVPALPEGWGMWLAGTATFGKAGRRHTGGAFDFSTSGITLGADKAVSEQLLLGVAAGWGKQDTDFEGTPSAVDADQRTLAMYGLWRLGDHLFVDGMLATGQLDFDLVRWSDLANASAHASRAGDQWFGSLTFGYEHRKASGLTLTSYGRYDEQRSRLDGYQEAGLGAYDLVYRSQDVDNSALALGLEGSLILKRDRWSWRPNWSIEYRGALDNRSDMSLNYVNRPMASDYVTAMRSYNDDALALTAGMDLQMESGWMFSLLLGHEQGRNAMRSNSIGVQVRYGQQSPRVPMYSDEAGAQAVGGSGRPCRGSSMRCTVPLEAQPK
jgi:uncharacterized protein YhjY with autotransporter beta-barrel domain